MTRASRRKSHVSGCLVGFIIFMLLTVGLGVAGYFYLQDSIQTTFEKIQTKEVSTEKIEMKRLQPAVAGKDPVSILLLGIDTGDFGRVEQGRSDIMIVLTLNPNTKKASLTSIPRDTYAEIVGRPGKDKLNHAYAFGGMSMSANSVQKLLQIPIDYVISVDMGGFTHIVDALGGIEITPSETFGQNGVSFQEGVPQVMDGATVLAYIRNRHTNKGDYGRQDRARQVLQATANKAKNLESLTRLPELIGIVEDNLQTNLTFAEAQTLGFDVAEILKNVEMISIKGETQIIDGIYYEVVSEDQLAQIRNKLKEEMEL